MAEQDQPRESNLMKSIVHIMENGTPLSQSRTWLGPITRNMAYNKAILQDQEG